MDFVDFLEVILKKLKETPEKAEYLRMVMLLRDTCNDTIRKLEEK